ncbi:MAG: tRNA preQ1(34) S-adenosylmethionine ribosyltransferase-isomerase QueA [Bacteroidales bacterium]|nr:tRNA preQ1(34) S-adenosylmethionine ribosyltransferase-isomerase QueA [Bacteroidales bacterium]MBD5341691.1 tRNA preQ1(34) S-adenosylmethionine ribosyltransferase-isomerase QueA [Bacteroides sp.]MDE6034055.1 tRNA preQ1(34) S-adenosylmethionine ribosyltransferase-isomerase QueA [Muribaculaceae bacterium]MBD5239470.1 tRNA preQ1(34) S-adenosylmethionine ribosyltransferase-isomerase QueA [Bacteroidales bacterium]MBD5352180.1 tRNA preQ1(34) S-adenosylmethionine ribosyltransferase-isomerase QueA [
MKLSQFNFNLPQELIAQYPRAERDEAKLMVLNRKTGKISHHLFKDIIDFFNEGDLMVFNDTRVFPARLYGNKERTNAKIEVFLLRELNPELKLWDVLVEPARKIRIGNKLYFGEDESLVAEVIDNTTSRGRTLRFLYDGPHDEFKQALYSLGQTPLPEHITREPEEIDAEAFQTVYATKEGAVVAPGAGLHYSRLLMKRLEIKGIEIGFMTVHSGLGTFREIDVEDLSKHRIDSEEVIIDQNLVDQVNKAKDSEHQVLAVGTSVLRGMVAGESMGGHLKEYSGWENKFIAPPYDFGVPTALVSNFHLPLSTMLMMVAAFGGYENVMRAYEEAVKEKYHFGTYGDSLLIL